MSKIHKNIINIIAFVFSIISVLCSIYAIVISRESNTIAKSAIRTSEDQFLRLNRPYILVEPKKIDDTNDYVKLSQEGRTIKCEVAYVLKNVGTAPAAYIRFPQQATTAGSNIHISQIQTPPRLPLAPNDKAEMGFMAIAYYDTEKLAKEDLPKFLDPNWPGIIVEIPVNYDNGLDFKQMYVTTVKLKFRIKEAEILKEELKTFNKNIKSNKIEIEEKI